MLPPVYSSLSGMRASEKVLDASAHNTANIHTEGFRKQSIVLEEKSPGGVAAEVVRGVTPPVSHIDQYGTEVEASNSDYTGEVVSQIEAKHLFACNAAVFRAADEMHGSLLDILA